MTVPSPCLKICEYKADLGWCRGCGRTLAEIGGWMQANDDGKRAIVARAAARLREGPSDPR